MRSRREWHVDWLPEHTELVRTRVSGAFKDTAAKIAEGAGQDLHKNIEGLISRTKEGAWCKLVYIYIYIYIYREREIDR